MSIVKVTDIQPSAWDELDQIVFKFAVADYIANPNLARPVCQNIITFDIESSNGHVVDGVAYKFDHERYAKDPEFYANAEHQSLLYIWQCAIETNTPDGIKVFVGRTWDEFRQFVEKLTLHIHGQALLGRPASEDAYRQLVAANKQAKFRPEYRIYVHNFPFEFQHLRNLFDKQFAEYKRKRSATFARKARKPMKSQINVDGVRIVFCDTLCLVVKSLESWCDDSKLPTKKLTVPKGYYDVIRTPITPLTDFEVQYAVNDVVSMIYGLDAYREKYGTLQEIPMTQTGEVRRICRSRIAQQDKEWAKRMYDITMSTSFDLYRVLVKTFGGGWVHANAYRAGIIWRNVRCFDFASSYPWVMTAFTYPITKFEETDPTHFDYYASEDPRSLDCKHHFLIRVHFHNLTRAKQNTYWSSSKCEELSRGSELDNGKVSFVPDITMYMTDVDYQVMKETYTWDWQDIEELYVAEAGMLSKTLITTILEYYSKKTEIKGTGQDSLYAETKQLINSIFGVFGTKDYTDDVIFGAPEDSSEWYSDALDEEKYYEKQLQTKIENTFTTYQIAPFITAYARSNLWTILKEVDGHTIYGDTDSLKGVFDDEDMKHIQAYNDFVLQRQDEVAALLGIDVNLFRPLKKNGKPDILGNFDEEETCLEFKTLGAKRYMDIIEIDLDEIIDIEPLRDTWQGKFRKNPKTPVHILSMDDKKARILQATIAGLPKASAYMNLDSLEEFTRRRVFSTEESGKKYTEYNDNQTPAKWIDDYGNVYYSEDKFGQCIIPTTFNLDISSEYDDYLSNKIGYSDGIPKVFQ